MPAKLLYRDVKGREGSVDLLAEPVYVGRATDCAIRTDDAMVSRRHSVIKQADGKYWVEDLQSANGTEVNTVKIQRHALSHNDTVRCGSLWLRFVITDGGPAVATPLAAPVAPPLTSPPASTTPPVGPTETTGVTSREVQRLRDEIAELRERLEAREAERDKEVAENKRLRVDQMNLQRRVDELTTQIRETEEVIEAHKKLAEDLRDGHEDMKEEHGKMEMSLGEATEALESKNRQLQRTQDDLAKAKLDVELQKKHNVELSKQKDDALRRLNEQLSEVEHLRQVIHEQERIFEEKRVALITLEEALKDLRQDREKRERETAALKSEREELRVGMQRQNAAVQRLEEEVRRYARLAGSTELD
jgi:hypothetical protein